MKIWLTLIVLSFSMVIFTQETPATQELFQIFLETPAKKVKCIEYIDSEKGPIKYQLSEDGKAIYLLNYDGSGGVHATVEMMEQATLSEISRSKCHIHNLPDL